MKAIKIKGDVIGSGIDYMKCVRNIPDRQAQEIKDNSDRDTFFYIKLPKKPLHYTQTGYKVVTHNRERYEYYHREPSVMQFVAILRKEGLVK